MTTAALLAYSGAPDLIDDDRLLLPALADLGIEARPVLWDDPETDWASFDIVVIREPWDYYLRAGEFRAWIDAREKDGTNLWNPPEVCRWNMNKRYLQELDGAGIPVVRTEWQAQGSAAALDAILAGNGWERAVVKPGISAGAHQTWVVSMEDARHRQGDLDALLAGGDVMVQPFIESFIDEGEWSFLFFGGVFSHAVLKKPAAGDFRVQPIWGGSAHTVSAPPSLIEQAERVCAAAPGELLYARVDGVRDEDALLLVELEILEPLLFLALRAQAPAAMAAAIASRLR